jgi:hypothetical protein
VPSGGAGWAPCEPREGVQMMWLWITLAVAVAIFAAEVEWIADG